MRNYPIFTICFSAYWFVFWMMNGLDKFFYGQDLGLLEWAGKDRHEQMNRYFGNIGIDNINVDSILAFAGYVEIAAAIPFALVCLMLFLAPRAGFDRAAELFQIALVGAFAIFLAFIAFDIIAGDRLELLEHSTYLAVIAVSLGVCHLELFLRNLAPNYGKPSPFENMSRYPAE